MSTVRLTIGGVDVSPYPGEIVAGVLPGVESQSAAGLDRARARNDSGHAPVTLAMAPTRQFRCPLPPGPWRVISTLALTGFIFILIAMLSKCRRRAE
jgi:hypothetical protein